MVFRVQILATACLVGMVLSDSKWLTYVCNPETGDYSVVSPNSSHYRYALVEGSGDDDCAYSFSEDYRTMNISSCKGNLVSVILSDTEVVREQGTIIGGRRAQSYGVSCDLSISSLRIGLAKIEIEASVVNSPDFADAEVAVSIRDLQGVEGYSLMTIGYPLTVQLTGPAGSSMLPKQCVAYSGEVSEDAKQKLVLTNGCSLDKELIFDFEENLGSWFDRGLEIPELPILMTEGEGGEEESQPVLATHMYAFRFYDSKKMILSCDVQLCPSEEASYCDMSCS